VDFHYNKYVVPQNYRGTCPVLGREVALRACKIKKPPQGLNDEMDSPIFVGALSHVFASHHYHDKIIGLDIYRAVFLLSLKL
jgi:hypothetical protein